MPYYDEIFKHIVGTYPQPLAALALKTADVRVGARLRTEHTTVRVHHSDMTFHIELSDEQAILHIEAQTDDNTHKPMPLRMLAYSSFLALEHEKNVYSTVLYFRPSSGQKDPGLYQYGDAARGGISFHYNVIRIYELAGEAFLDAEAIGILPFTALMKPPADMPPHAWVEKCIETTETAEVDRQTRATLLFALSLFGSLAHPPELFQEPTLEAIMQESPFYELVMQRGIEQGKEEGREEGREQGREEGIQQGIEQGIQQGARQMSIDNTLTILESHFPEADINPIKDKLQTITDIEKLKQINRNALYAKSLQEFEESL